MSAGMDHCIRLWDVVSGVNKSTLVCLKSFLCVYVVSVTNVRILCVRFSFSVATMHARLCFLFRMGRRYSTASTAVTKMGWLRLLIQTSLCGYGTHALEVSIGETLYTLVQTGSPFFLLQVFFGIQVYVCSIDLVCVCVCVCVCVPESSVVQSVLSSHQGWVVAVQWSPSKEHQLLSGSYDSSLK